MLDDAQLHSGRPCVIYVANTAWYLYNFRLSLLRAMVAKGWRVIAVAPPDRFASMLTSGGLEFIPIELQRRGANPIAEVRPMMRLFRLYRENQPSLVHHFTIKPVLYGSFAAQLAGIRANVCSITGLGFLFISKRASVAVIRPLARLAYRFVLNRRATRVIFQNPDDLREFVESRLLRRSLARLIRGSGVNPDRFERHVEPPLPVVAVLCARMLWDKGVGELVAAARLLKERGLPIRVVLVGDLDAGNPASISKEWLDGVVSAGWVEWRGHREDIPDILRGAHVAILPSYREGVPRSLVEAAAAGLPLIATDVPGCREIVRNGLNGILVPPRNVEALANALERLGTDSELRQRMGQESRRIAVTEFSETQVIDETLAVYRELLGATE